LQLYSSRDAVFESNVSLDPAKYWKDTNSYIGK
jgi:hypothetical protein